MPRLQRAALAAALAVSLVGCLWLLASVPAPEPRTAGPTRSLGEAAASPRPRLVRQRDVPPELAPPQETVRPAAAEDDGFAVEFDEGVVLDLDAFVAEEDPLRDPSLHLADGSFLTGDEIDPSLPRLSGTLLEPDGEPLGDASVELYRLAPKPAADGTLASTLAELRAGPPQAILGVLSRTSATVYTNLAGHFEVPVPPGTQPLVLLLRHPDHLDLVSDPFSDLPTAPLLIRVPEAGELVVRFTTDSDEQVLLPGSVPGVTVNSDAAGALNVGPLRLRYPLRDHSRLNIRGGISFTYDLNQAPSEDSLTQRFPAWGDVTVELDDFDFLPQRATARVSPGEVIEVELLLSVGEPIEGVVVDTQGTPLPGIGVGAKHKGGMQLGDTDGAGRFRFEALEEPEYELVILHPAARGAPGVSAAPGDPPLRLVLDDASTGALTVEFAGGGERHAWRLRLEPLDPDSHAVPLTLPSEPGPVGERALTRSQRIQRATSPYGRDRVPTDPRISYVPAGRYRLAGRLGDRVPRGAPEVVIRPGETTAVALRLEQGRTVALAVVDAAGDPVEEAVVEVPGYVHEGLRGGRGELRGLPWRPLTLSVRAEGLVQARVDLDAQAETAQAVLTPGVTIQGTLYDAAGVPLSDAYLRFHGDTGDFQSAQSDAHGRFRSAGFEPGMSYRGGVYVDGRYRRFTAPVVAPTADAVTDLRCEPE